DLRPLARVAGVREAPARSAGGARTPIRARRAIERGRMDVLTPHSLDEALRMKAQVPWAVPIQGGTDVMVDLNFDRARPDVLLNLNEVPELRGWSQSKGDQSNGELRLGAGLTYTEVEAELPDRLP